MRRITSIVAGAGALVIGVSLSAWAHDTSINAAAKSSSDRFALIDEDGDGINDCVAREHWTQRRMGKSWKGGGQGLGSITLTEDQKTQIDRLKSDHQKAVISFQAALRTKEVELRDLRKATTPDQNAIGAKIAEINSVRSQMKQANASYRSSVLSALTAEQRANMDARRLGLTRAGITLTADQQAQIDRLTSDHQQATASLQAAFQTKQMELRALEKAATPDRNAINAKIDELNAARADLQKEMTNYRLAVRGMLTADQQAALDARIASFESGHGHGRGWGRGQKDRDKDRDKDHDRGHRG